jgi:hypothetical protein
VVYPICHRKGPSPHSETLLFPLTPSQALRLSNPDLSQLPTTTTTPDDVFYVLKVVMSRILSTGSLHAVEKTLEHFRDVVDRDYAGVIKKKLDDVYRTAGSSSVGRVEKVERENRFAFIVSPLFAAMLFSILISCRCF